MAKTLIPQEPHEHEQSEPDEKVVHLLSRVGCLDPEQGEESHFHWSEKRARMHPGSTQSGVSLPETLPPGFGSLLTIHLPHPSA